MSKFSFRPRLLSVPMGLPHELPQYNEAQAVIETWKNTFPPSTDPTDFEDFHENAIRLHYAKLHGEVKILPRYLIKHDPSDIFLGIEIKNENDVRDAVSDYHLLSSFNKYAGRISKPVDFIGDSVATTIGEFRKAGVEKIYGKVMYDAKYLNEVLYLSDQPSDQDAARELFGYSLAHFEGEKNAALIQEFIPMHYEYRLIIANGKIVTGAGCIEEFTPYNRLNFDEPFDPQLRKTRNYFHEENSEVIIDKTITAELIDFGNKAYAEILQEAPSIREGTIDVAMGPKGPLVIELNKGPNYGLYAANFKKVIEAYSA